MKANFVRLLIAGATILALTSSASAAEVRPGGALDITISGFVRFLTAYGEIEDKPNLGTFLQEEFPTTRGPGAGARPSNFDFLNDTEIHVILRGKDDATGIEYGGTIEFEADTSDEENTEDRKSVV